MPPLIRGETPPKVQRPSNGRPALDARTAAQPHVIMMFAVGFGAFIMAPTVGINYLYQRKSLKLWLIDAGHFVFGMAAMGGVFVVLS